MLSEIAIYPGTFDPLTYGHLDVVKRASKIFPRIIVAVAHNSQKTSLFTLEERMDMMKEAVKGITNVEIETFQGLVVDYARSKKANVLIRGLRMISDFEFEFQMALTNRRLDETVETVFLMPSEGYSFLSSALLREAASLGADTSSFVPGFIGERLREKFAQSQ